MSRDLWLRLDDFYADALHANDPVLDRVLQNSSDAGLRDIAVGKNQGKLLMLLVMATEARRVLEIGTLGGYGALWLAKGLPEGGTVVTLERDPDIAHIARRNIEEAGATSQIHIRVGDAVETLQSMIDAGEQSFDVVFIDADRSQMKDYVQRVLELSHPGTVILADNVVRYGYVADPSESNAQLEGVRAFLQFAGSEPGLECTAIQTVSGKGHDGFAMCVVR